MSQELKLPIYLDHHATTPVDPQVLSAMLPFFTQVFGNAASRNHEFGWTAEAAVVKARRQVARLLGATESEIIFTSGATESNNLALLGVAEKLSSKGKHVLISSVEHRSVLDVAEHLAKQGFEIERVPVTALGEVDAIELARRIRKDTILVSVMAANNEIGTINPLAAIGKLCHERGVYFHTDAAQALGKIPLDVNAMSIDLMSITAHKIYGPKGVGALFVRRRGPRVALEPQIHGGGHERGFRSGTLNVPGIVGFGKAAELAQKLMVEESKRLAALRDRLWNGIQAKISDVRLNGHPVERLPNNLNVSFAYVEGESLMMAAKELAVSSGSACSSASHEPSYVLREIGLSEDLARSSIRFGLGRFTTEEAIDYAIDRLAVVVEQLRKASPVYGMKDYDDQYNDEFTGVEL